jgi:hypothetical protein
MRWTIGTAMVSTLAGLTAAAPASAELLQFTLTGPYEAVWFIDSNPTPNSVGSDSFVLQDVVGNYSQIPGNTGTVYSLADFEFYNADFDGGFYASNFYDGNDLLTADGAQLFSGAVAAPTFTSGSYTLTDYSDRSITYNLTIGSAALPAVPEPASWALMILGFGVIGGTMRYRRSAKPNVRFA